MRNPNGYGCVSKMSGNRRNSWRVRKTVTCIVDEKTGKTTQTYKTIGYYPSQEEANIALANYNQNPYDMDAVKITFAEVYDKWSDKHFEKVSTSNIKGYRAAYLLCEPLYKMKFADIRTAHLQAVVDCSGKNYPTLRKLKVLMNQVYKFSMQNDICGKDYSDFVDIVQYKDRNPNKIDRLPFSTTEIDTVWKWADKNEYASVILMLIYSGIRIGEFRDLKKVNVHLEERYFDILESKTESGIRKVPIAQKILPFFQYWMNKNDCEYLISTREGKYFHDRNFRDSYWGIMIKEMSLDVEHHPHDTRHTCISLLAAANVSDKIIKKIVGHKGQGVTETVYTHFDVQQLIDAIDLI